MADEETTVVEAERPHNGFAAKAWVRRWMDMAAALQAPASRQDCSVCAEEGRERERGRGG